MFAFLVHQEVRDAHGCLDQHLARPAARAFFLDLTNDRQGKVVIRPDQTSAMAGLTRLCCRLDHAGAQTLA